jgi:hypothetical protein
MEVDMLKLLTTASLWILLCHCWIPSALAEEATSDHLLGRWVIDAKDCSSKESEYIIYKPDGTFEYSRSGATEIVGFWELKGDLLDMHMVSSPAYFQDIHKELKDLKGVYGYYHAKLVLFNVEKTSHQVVGVMGNEIKKGKAIKCK